MDKLVNEEFNFMIFLTSNGLHNKKPLIKTLHVFIEEWMEWDENCVKHNPSKDIVKLQLEDYEEGKFDIKSFDSLVMHGGSVPRIHKLVLKKNFLPIIKYFINKKKYIGVSAGSMILAEQSTFIKDGDEFRRNILYKKLLGISKLRVDVHYDVMRDNKTYMRGLKEASEELGDEKIYLLENGAFIVDDKIFHGNVWIAKNGEIFKK